jgi:glycerate kinase
MVRGVLAALPQAEVRRCPVADGGDGTLDTLLAAGAGAGAEPRVETLLVAGPLGDPVSAQLGFIDGRTAVVELAEAAGLRLCTGRLEPLRASTRGVGQLLGAALDAGAERVIIGVGGSASTDGGAGLCAALGAELRDVDGNAVADGGGALARLAALDVALLQRRLAGCQIEAAVDVLAPLLGSGGAARVFAPQKGASPADVALLEAGLERWAEVVERDLGVDPGLRELPGAGAGGGCGYGLAAVCGASLVPGASLVCDVVGLDAALHGADLVLTGEGRLDASTAAGKAPAEVARRARRAGVPCIVLAGSVTPPVDAAYSEAVAIAGGLATAEAMGRAADLLESATRWVCQRFLNEP